MLINESWAAWTATGAHNTELDTTKEGYLLPTLVLPTQPATVIVLLAQDLNVQKYPLGVLVENADFWPQPRKDSQSVGLAGDVES